MPFVLAVCSQKGGSGKSTVVTGLADALVQSAQRVLVLDADAPQHTLLRWYGEAHKLPKFASLIVEAAPGADLHKRRWPAADTVIIDCPGRLDGVVRSALAAADALGQAEAVFARQIHIDQVQVRQISGRGVVHIFSCHHTCHMVALGLQKVHCCLTQVVVVFHDKNVKQGGDGHGNAGC